MKSWLKVSTMMCCISCCLPCMAACPSADLTGDCKVDFADLAVLASQWLNVGETPNMVSIPNGMFQMGDPCNEGYLDERPVHSVTLNSFQICNYCTTNRQYCAFLDSAAVKVFNGWVYGSSDSNNRYPYCATSLSDSGSQIGYSNGLFFVRTKSGRDMANDPMIMVTWYGAVAYCNWRSQQESKELCYDLTTWICDFSKKGYRLPTEAEREYAARNGLSGKRFPWGDTITHNQANYYSDATYFYDVSSTRGYHPFWSSDEIWPYTSPVGSFAGNGYGLYDVTGNVWEWCNDWYSSSYYSSSPANNPAGPASGSFRVLRGGSWFSSALYCRTACRNSASPSQLNLDNGFRIVLISQ